MNIKDFMVETFGECPGNYLKQEKIVNDLKLQLFLEEKKLQDILLWERSKQAIEYYKVATNNNEETK
jgi:hypothetical protein